MPTSRDFVEAVRRVGDGGTVLDPEVVTPAARARPPAGPARPAHAPRAQRARADGRGPLERRHRAPLVVSDGAVEKHVSSIFTKLDLPPAAEDHRRVLAVLQWLES